MQARTADAYDRDLNPVLEKASSEDLQFLVELLNKQLNSSLELTAVYKQHHPNHTAYADLIAKEIREYGGHTLKEPCPAYKKVVCKVARRLKAPYNPKQPVEMIENAIVGVIVEKTFDKLNDEEKREILRTVGSDTTLDSLKDMRGVTLTAVILKLFNMGGFKSYQLMLLIVNAISTVTLGHALRGVGNVALCRIAGVLTGPIGWVLMGLLAVVDLLGPAYRVAIPAVVCIAMLRKQQELAEQLKK